MDGDDDGSSSSSLKALAVGYEYLLKMPISSLTKEKVARLLKDQEETNHKVKALKSRTVKDLWRSDLDQLEGHLDEYRVQFEENVERMRMEAEAKRKGTKVPVAKKRKKRT